MRPHHLLLQQDCKLLTDTATEACWVRIDLDIGTFRWTDYPSLRHVTQVSSLTSLTSCNQQVSSKHWQGSNPPKQTRVNNTHRENLFYFSLASAVHLGSFWSNFLFPTLAETSVAPICTDKEIRYKLQNTIICKVGCTESSSEQQHWLQGDGEGVKGTTAGKTNCF